MRIYRLSNGDQSASRDGIWQHSSKTPPRPCSARSQQSQSRGFDRLIDATSHEAAVSGTLTLTLALHQHTHSPSPLPLPYTPRQSLLGLSCRRRHLPTDYDPSSKRHVLPARKL